jgi:hypothetical protein
MSRGSELPANNYHLRYVIVGSDSESGYNSSIVLADEVVRNKHATLGNVATA